MKIATVGTGAMGSVYAALLADAGDKVGAIDVWRAQLDAIERQGLRVDGASGGVFHFRLGSEAAVLMNVRKGLPWGAKQT